MKRVPLESRMIESVAYNADTTALHVWLRSKRHEVHQGVSSEMYQKLLSAQSAGFYYFYYIRSAIPPARSKRLSSRWYLTAMLVAGLTVFP